MQLAAKRGSLALAALLIFALASPLKAQSSQQLTAGQVFARAVGSQKSLDNEEGRTSVILAFGRYCAALKDVFPTNSPSESEWLSTELQGGGDRIIRAFSSKEFGRVMAARFFRDCAFATQLYENDPSARPQAVFMLIEASAAFAKDAERVSRVNGVNPDGWAFFILGGSAVETLAQIGIAESNLSLSGTDVVRNVGQ